jgi:hypothetical protein
MESSQFVSGNRDRRCVQRHTTISIVVLVFTPDPLASVVLLPSRIKGIAGQERWIYWKGVREFGCAPMERGYDEKQGVRNDINPHRWFSFACLLIYSMFGQHMDLATPVPC